MEFNCEVFKTNAIYESDCIAPGRQARPFAQMELCVARPCQIFFCKTQLIAYLQDAEGKHRFHSKKNPAGLLGWILNVVRPTSLEFFSNGQKAFALRALCFGWACSVSSILSWAESTFAKKDPAKVVHFSDAEEVLEEGEEDVLGECLLPNNCIVLKNLRQKRFNQLLEAYNGSNRTSKKKYSDMFERVRRRIPRRLIESVVTRPPAFNQVKIPKIVSMEQQGISDMMKNMGDVREAASEAKEVVESASAALATLKPLLVHSDHVIDKLNASVNHIPILIGTGGDIIVDKVKEVISMFEKSEGIEKLTRAVTNLDNVLQNPTSWSLADTAAKIVDQNVLKDALTAYNHHSDKISKDCSTLEMIERMSGVLLFCVSLMFCESSALAGSVLLGFLASHGVVSKLTKWLAGIIRDVHTVFTVCNTPRNSTSTLLRQTTPTSEPMEQHGLEQQGLEWAVAPLSRLLAVVMASKCIPEGANKLGNIMTMGLAARSLKSINDLGSMIREAWKGASEMVYVAFTGLPPAGVDPSYTADVEAWFKFVQQDVANPLWMSDVTTNKAKIDLIHEAHVQGYYLQEQMARGRTNPALVSAVKEHQRILLKAVDLIKEMVSTFDNRIKPTCVFIFGPTGVGKSHMIRYLTMAVWGQALSKEQKKDKTEQDLVYTKSRTSEYWAKYNHQFCTVLDEFNQLALGTTMDSEREIMEIFDLINETDVPLNMPDVESKGRVFFDSQLVILTSNSPHPDLSCITSPSAFRRRVKFMVQPKVKAAFATAAGELDKTKWLQHCAAQNPPLRSEKPDWLVFNCFDITKGSGTLVPIQNLTNISFDVLLQEVVANVKAEQAAALDRKSQLSGFFSEMQQQGFGDFGARNFSFKKIALSQYKDVSTSGPDTLSFDQLKLLVDFGTVEDSVKGWWNGLPSSSKLDVYAKLLESHHQDNFNLVSISNALQCTTSVQHLKLKLNFDAWNEALSRSPILVSWWKKFQTKWQELNTKYGLAKWLKVGGVAIGLVIAAIGIFHAWKYVSDKGGVKSMVKESLNIGLQQETGPSDRSSSRVKARKWTRVNNMTLQSEAIEADDDIVLVNNYRMKLMNFDVSQLEQQALLDTAEEDLVGKMIPNLAMVAFKDGSGTERMRTNGMFVNAQWLLIPSHLLKYQTTIEQWSLTITTLSGSLVVYGEDIPIRVAIGDKYSYDDVILVKMPYPGPYASLVRRFASEDEMALISEVPGELVVIRPERRRVVMRYAMNIKQHQKYVEDTGVRTLVEGGALCATVGWRYQAFTSKGDCGSPILRMDPKHQTKILGVHCAGEVGYGFGCYVTSNWLDSVTNSTVYQSQALDLEPYQKGVHPENCLVLGKFGTPLHISRKTDIRRSPLDLWEPKTAPAALRPVGGLDPLKLALDKMVIKHVRVKYADHLVFTVLSSMGKGEARLLTDHEILNGLEDESLNRINIHTSPGIPYVIQGYQGKKRLVIGDEGVYQFTPTLMKVMLEREKKAQSGVSIPALFMDCMKDERRTLEKVQSLRTRLISTAPLDHTLLVRKYFGMFISHCVRMRHSIPIKVGIDPHSEWTVLYDALVSKADKFLAGDIRAMDAHTGPDLMSQFVTIVNQWYDDGPMNAMIREVLMMSIYMPVHVVGEVVYTGLGGNPSGWAGTTILNSVNLWCCILHALSKLTGMHPMKIMQRVSMAVYGDDSVVGIPSDFEITPESFKQQMRLLGFEYTSAKKGFPVEYESVEQITFLRRSFRRSSGVILPPLDIDVVVEIPLWVRGSNDLLLKVEQNVNDTLLELAYHPPHVVRPYIVKLFEQIFKFDIRVTVPDSMLFELCSSMRQESIGTDWMLLKLLKVALFVCPVKKIRVSLSDIMEMKEVLFVPAVWDLSCWVPFLSKNIYFHSGLLIQGGKYDGWHLAFDGSFIMCKPDTKPRLTFFPVENDFVCKKMIEFKTGQYHLFKRNCNHFTSLFLGKTQKNFFDASNNRLEEMAARSWPHWYAKENVRVLKECVYKQQGEDNDPKVTNIENIKTSELTSRTEAPLDVERVAVSCFTGKISNSGPTPTIRSVLERAELVRVLTWTTETESTKLATIEMPFDVLKTVEQFKVKAMYNTLMRYNIFVEAKLVSNPFQCGSVLIVWRPLWHLMKESCPDQTIYSKTANHSVMLYAGDVRRASLIIPYASPQEASNLVLQSAYDKLGRLEVVVVNPLRSGAGADLKCTVYLRVSFRDFEVYGPTSGSLDGAKGEQSTTSIAPVIYGSQGDEQQEKSQQGVISGITTVIAGAATMLRGIPIIGNSIGVVGRVAEGVTSIAQALGLSKPTSLEVTHPMIPRPFCGVSFVDGLDNSQKLSTDPKNEIAIIPCLFGTNVDEMSIPYVIRTPMLLLKAPWRNSHPKDEALLKIPVTPTVAQPRQTLGRRSYQLSHMGWVAMCFRYWRGSINFTVEVVNSQMHRGSLLIAFHPYGRYNKGKQPLSKVSHHILDLSEDNAVDVSVPFLSQTPYKKVLLVEVENPMGYGDEIVTGQLVISVLAELSGPSTVSKEVEINVWLRAGHDMEFAQPTIESIRYWHYVDEGGYEQQGRLGRAQSQLGPDSTTLPMFDGTLAGVKGVVMGESISSLRSLLKIFSNRLRGTVDVETSQRMQIPVSMIVSKYDEIDPDKIKGITYLDHVLRIYAMSRGSVRHKWYFPMIDAVVTATMRQLKLGDFDGKFKPAEGVPLEGLPWCMTHLRLNPTLEYEAPFYNHRMADVTGDVSDTRAVEVHVTPLVELKSEKVSWAMYEAVGDDFSCGCLIGPPLVLHSQYDESIFNQMFQYLDGMYNGRIITTTLKCRDADVAHNIVSMKSKDPLWEPGFKYQTGGAYGTMAFGNRMKRDMWYKGNGEHVVLGGGRRLIMLAHVNKPHGDFKIETQTIITSSKIIPLVGEYYFMVWSEIDGVVEAGGKSYKCKTTEHDFDQMLFRLKSDKTGQLIGGETSWKYDTNNPTPQIEAAMCETTYAPVLFDRFMEYIKEAFKSVSPVRVAYEFSPVDSFEFVAPMEDD